MEKVKPTGKTPGPPKLTPTEKEILYRCFHMQDWQFEKLFINNCVRIGHRILAWEKQKGKDEDKCIDVCIYGIQAKYPSVKYPIIASFFIQFDHKYRLYQRREIEDAINLVDLLQKEYLRDRYEVKISEEKEKGKLKKVA